MFSVCCATQAVRLHTICWARICEATGPPWPNPLQCGRMRSRGLEDVAQFENYWKLSAHVSSCQLSTLSWSLWCSASSQFIWLHLVARCSTQFRPASPCFNWMHTTAPRLSVVWKNEFRNLAETGWHGCYMLSQYDISIYLDTSRLWPAYVPGGCNRAITLAHYIRLYIYT